jgi:hypothetical protein
MPCGSNLEAAWEALRRVITSDNLKDQVHVEGVVHLEVKLLPLLGDARMKDMLRRTLREQGWTEDPDGGLSRDFNGATATLAPDGGAVTLRVTNTTEVQAKLQGSVAKTASNTEEREAVKELNAQAKAALDRQREQARERLEREQIRVLAAAEPELRAKLQEALNRTYREALEERARELGELESLQERGDVKGDYEVTVVVRA